MPLDAALANVRCIAFNTNYSTCWFRKHFVAKRSYSSTSLSPNVLVALSSISLTFLLPITLHGTIYKRSSYYETFFLHPPLRFTRVFNEPSSKQKDQDVSDEARRNRSAKVYSLVQLVINVLHPYSDN